MTSLTAADVWKLKELEAKATPAPWFWDMTISLRPFAACADSGYADLPHKKSDGQLIAHMRNALPALLAMLQPPVAADVAEARRILEHVCAGGGTSMVGVIHTLLADHARLAAENAAQAERIKRLEEHVVKALTMLPDCPGERVLRAALKEASRG